MEEIKHTYCRVCEPNCGLEVTVTDGKITKIAGDKEHPISQGYICQRGRATLEIHNDPDRLKYPVKKDKGEWKAVSWDQALSDIGRRLKTIREQYGPDSVAVYIGNPLAFDFGFSFYMPFARKAMQTRNFYSAGTQDCNNKFAASQRVYGSPLIHPIPDVDKIDFLIVFGSNPAVSGMSFISLTRPLERLRAIEKRGGRVIFIDPRRTETVKSLKEHIFIRPDTDIYMLLAMLHVIISEELYDKNTVNAHTKGFADLKNLAAKYPPKRVASVTGISQDVIESLARDFAIAENAGIHGSIGINQSSFGTLNYWLIQSLNAITGRLDRRGSMIFCDMLVDASGAFKVRDTKYSRIGNYPEVLGTFPAGVLADEILTPGNGQIKAMIVISGNPLLTVPGENKLKKAMKSLDLMVSLDCFINETGALGDYVLPCKDFFERLDLGMMATMFNPIRYVNYTEPVVQADGEQRDTWIALHYLLRASGYEPGGNKVLAIVFDILDKIKERLPNIDILGLLPKLLIKLMFIKSDVSWKELKNSRQGVLLKDHKPGNFFKNRIMTPDKKFDLAPPEFIREADEIEDFFKKEKRYKGLKLIGQRQRRTHNSWFHNVESFVKKEKTNCASINPGDAKVLKIKDNDIVEVKSRFGRIKIPAKVTDDVMSGVVAVPHGWGHDKPSGLTIARKYPGVNVNKITPSGPGNLEKFAGMAKLTGIRVSVKKV